MSGAAAGALSMLGSCSVWSSIMDEVNINTLFPAATGSFHIYKLAFAWETPTYLHGRDVGVLHTC